MADNKAGESGGGSRSAEKFAEMVIEQLEAGTAPWLHPVEPGIVGSAPMNPKTGVAYRGVNSLMLTMMQPDADPRWMTLRQANELEAKVRKGSRGVPIRALVGWETEEGRKLEKSESPPAGSRPLFRAYSVFHASQIEGLEAHPAPEAGELDWSPVERAEELLERSGAMIEHDQVNRCFYAQREDRIHLPPKENFRDAESYYSTALHELGHWTGHESRLGRDMGGGFGSEGYAREELRAELASYMLAMELGIGHDPGNHAAYVQSWVKELREKPLEILRASEDAMKVVDFVMGRDRGLEKGREEERKAGLEYEATAEGRLLVGVGGDVLGVIREEGGEPTFYRSEEGQARGMPDEASHEDGIEGLKAMLENQFALASKYRDGEAVAPMLGAREEGRTAVGEPGAYDLPAGSGFGLQFLRQDTEPPYSEVLVGGLVIGNAEPKGEGWAFEPAEAGRQMGMPQVAEGGTELQFKSRLQNEFRENALYGRRVDLDVAYEDRKKAKGRGAKWDPGKKTWYAVLSSETIHNLSPWLQGAVQVGAAPDGREADEARAPKDADGAKGKEDAPKGAGGGKASAPSRRRVDLQVPYTERAEAKRLGALWDAGRKTWFAMVGEGEPLGELGKWGRGGPAPERPSATSEFKAFCQAAGLVIEGEPIMDGERHRVPVEGGKPGSKDGMYVGHLDGRPAGFVQNWRSGDAAPWRFTGEGHAIERHADAAKESRQKAEQNRKDREAAQVAKAAEVEALVGGLEPASQDHRYLVEHGATPAPGNGAERPYGALQDGEGNLVVPLRDAAGKVWSVQRIGENGFKRFEKGGRVSGLFHVVGHEAELGANDAVLVTAGFGTGAAVNAATGLPVVCAMMDGNLAKVAADLSKRFEGKAVLILADDDRHTVVNGEPRNSGRISAEAALDGVAMGRVAYPQWTAEERADKGMTDFADLVVSRGREALARQVGQELAAAKGLVKAAQAEVRKPRSREREGVGR